MTDPNPPFSEITQLHAEVCSALADPRRIQILYTLSAQPLTVNEIALSAHVSQPVASRHLKVLRESGLVSATRQGMSVEYSLADPRLIQVLDLLREVMQDRILRRASLIENQLSQ